MNTLTSLEKMDTALISLQPEYMSHAILKHNTWWLVAVCIVTAFILCLLFWGSMDFILKESKTATLKIQYLTKKDQEEKQQQQEELDDEEKESGFVGTSINTTSPTHTKERIRHFNEPVRSKE